jgi:hypothetical protein
VTCARTAVTGADHHHASGEDASGDGGCHRALVLLVARLSHTRSGKDGKVDTTRSTGVTAAREPSPRSPARAQRG